MAILAPELEDARVLDLFAGSGTLGLAALERGAGEVVFVEEDPQVFRDLRGKLPEGCRLMRGRLPQALARLKGRFDVILADPPYGDPAGPATLARLEALLAEGGVAVFEHHHKDDFGDQVGRLQLARRERYGETALSFYRVATP